MNNFEFVRKYKNPNVRRNRLVTYHGQLYRIAACDGGNLTLRRQIYVHPNDPALKYSSMDGIEHLRARIEREKAMLEDRSNALPDDKLWELEGKKDFLRGLETALRVLNGSQEWAES